MFSSQSKEKGRFELGMVKHTHVEDKLFPFCVCKERLPV